MLTLLLTLVVSVSSYGQLATKAQWGVARSTDSLNETRDGFLLGPGAGRYLKVLIDSNTANLVRKQPLLTTSSNVVSGTLTAGKIFLQGATAAETARNSILPLPGGGVEFGGNPRLSAAGIGAGGNLDVKPDGNLYFFSNGNSSRSLFLHNEGISVNRNTNTARAGFDIGSDVWVDGNLKLPTVDGRWFGFDGLSSGQTVRLRMGDPTGGLDVTSGAGMTVKAYHGIIVQNQAGGAGPALRVNGLSSGQNLFEFYDAASALRASLSQAGILSLGAGGGVRFADGSTQTTAAGTAAPISVTIAASETALLNAIAAATVPTVVSWTGVITQTQTIVINNKTELYLDCYGKGGLSRSNSPDQILVNGNNKNVGFRGIAFVNTNTTGTNGAQIRINEQGPEDGIFIEDNTFLNAGTNNNSIASNASGGAQDQFITSHKRFYIRRNTFGGSVGSGTGISRMAIELLNHSADGPGPIQYCEEFVIEDNKIYKPGTGSDDGFGISLSGLIRKSRIKGNTVIDAERYSIEIVLGANILVEDNTVIDIDNSSVGISISNGYKAENAIPAGANQNIIVNRNRINVKQRAILAYYVSNSIYTRNIFKSQQRNEFIGNENVFANNTIDVYNDWNALYFARSSRNKIVDNTATTYYHGNGIYTSSVIFFDAGSNDSYVRLNTLTRPTNSYNVHIEQASGTSNDTGAGFQSATNTLNTYAEKRPNTLGNDQIQVATYQDMINLGTVTVSTTVYVLADEKNNPGALSVYTLLPSGKRVRFAAIEDN
ncbi:right-handed parallel beta-helix repeat-containing protein [Spirosoma rhododendri]|uniref:Right handed beta helix domain-containing protein n=1 Tax=Spirosoma rhododendri TaxID=2728024 RepID=A0A7L5DQQ5_9BACT|nr:right-handed parallel beta-helix repeat-containing protein [Spirosoma rhododendri]QJD79563.1 hypothetical protein HH216_14930 [Spirosoma rhododendri]